MINQLITQLRFQTSSFSAVDMEAENVKFRRRDWFGHNVPL